MKLDVATIGTVKFEVFNSTTQTVLKTFQVKTQNTGMAVGKGDCGEHSPLSACYTGILVFAVLTGYRSALVGLRYQTGKPEIGVLRGYYQPTATTMKVVGSVQKLPFADGGCRVECFGNELAEFESVDEAIALPPAAWLQLGVPNDPNSFLFILYNSMTYHR